MAVLSKKPYPPPGIGRGHSSLPPKPGFVGKPLPRDTDAIVLTPGGGEGLSFAPSTKPKRTYSSVASENIMRPMDPAVTNLTPQNRVSPSATNHHTIPHSITPPAEPSLASKGSPPSQVHTDANSNSGSISVSVGSPRSPLGPNARTDQTPSSNSIDSQLVHNGSNNTDRPQMYRSEQQTHEHPQMANFPTNGVPPPEMYHPMGPQQFGIHHPPPHAHHHQPGGFFTQHYHGGTPTPPNSGPMFLAPSMQPHMEHIMYNEMVINTSPDGGNGTGQHNMFGPGYGGFQPPTDHSIHHPVMQPFSSLPTGPSSQVQPRQDEFPRPHITPPRSNASEQAMDGTGARKELPRNPRLKGISFVVPDDEARETIQDTLTPVASSGRGTPTTGASTQPGANGIVKKEDRAQLPPPTPMTSLESYTTKQFLNKKLADVTLVLVNPTTQQTERFPAHSFVLGRSDKLYQLLEHAEKSDSSFNPTLVRTNSTTSWADEMEGEYALTSSPSIKATYSTQDGFTTITFETSVNRESFLLGLKTLYGASDWEIDTFLNLSHPGHQPTHDITSHDSDNGSEASSVIHHQPSPEPSRTEVITPEVQMLERAIDLFCAGVLLGLDGIICKAIGRIRQWGLSFDGGAFERLMKFLLEDSQEMRHDKSLHSPHWNFTDSLLSDAIDIFAHSIADDFKLDFRAPSSEYINRLSCTQASSYPQTGLRTPPGINQIQRTRQIQSTILISLPFEIMKRILEHGGLAPNGRKKRFDLASSVVQERERRRKRELKAFQDMIDKKNGSESGGDSNSDILAMDTYPEVLCWEESAVSTFGHGGVGIEIAKRRKGGPGGRMLWKVGNRASN
ncbi:hypothetical protein K440DRAFT_616573 [Wilcoxina mikolae CBS 423.85]|nr:hypothetical protein K440DRAFT_616573 [Wilcoxina mikolae CBS 423.85]